MYIILEGIDTAGKSTQLDILKEKFSEAVFTKEPGGTPMGMLLRKMALGGEASSKIAEMFLFLADRAEHAHSIVETNKNSMLISDRGFVSGIAYAVEFDIEKLIPLNLLALDGNLPQKIIMLKLSKDELEYRLSQKEHDSIESRGSQYLLDIQSRMEIAIKKINELVDQKIETLIVDASEPIEKIASDIEEFIEK